MTQYLVARLSGGLDHRSYSTPDLFSTWLGKLSRHVCSQLSRLSLRGMV